MTLFPEQCKAARGLLGWGLRELATAARVAPDTVARFERDEDLKPRTIDAIRVALEDAGIHLTFGHRPGISIRTDLLEQSKKNGIYIFQCKRLGQHFEVRADKKTVDKYARLNGVREISTYVAARVSRALLPPHRKKPVRGIFTLSVEDLAAEYGDW